MIVSNSSSNVPNPLQGIDFAARVKPADAGADTAVSSQNSPQNFSDVLETKVAPAQGFSVRKTGAGNGAFTLRASRVSQQGKASAAQLDSKKAASGSQDAASNSGGSKGSPSEGIVGTRDPRLVTAKDGKNANTSTVDSPQVSAFSDPSPLPRDSRLDDPAELALEAAAAALISGQQPLQAYLAPNSEAEVDLDSQSSSSGASDGSSAFEGGAGAALANLSVTSTESQSDALALRALQTGIRFASIATTQGANETVAAVKNPTSNLQPGISVPSASLQAPESFQTSVPQGGADDSQTQSRAGERAPLSVPSQNGLLTASEAVKLQSVPQLVLSANSAQAAAIAGISISAPKPAPLKTDLLSGSGVGASGENVTAPVRDSLAALSELPVQDASVVNLASHLEPVSPARAFFASRLDVKSRDAASSGDLVVQPSLGDVFQGANITENSTSSGGENQQSGQNLSQKEARPEGASSSLPSAPAPHVDRAVEPKSQSLSGTRGAISDPVPKETSPIRVSSEQTAQTALSDSGDSVSAVVDHSTVTASVNSLQSPVSHGALESSRPTVLPATQVRTPGEAWRVIQDAIQRARSENPSHLAVEVKLADGSSMGVELRLSSSGLQASFRSESQFLLKAIEANWSGFLAKESGDLKVASAVFEGRGGFSDFSNGNSNGGSTAGERREQFENNAASANLRFSNDGGSFSSTPKGAPSSTLERPVAPGEMALYA